MSELELFEKALEITDPAERYAFVELECGADQALRDRVVALLKSHELSSQFLKVPLVEQLWSPVGETLEASNVSELRDARSNHATRNEDSEANASDPEDADHPDLSFLQPATRDGAIGRLGHYEIFSVLGHGAFGIVFKAFDDKLHRYVAIKAMTPHVASTSPPRKRFLREARSVAAIKHENIVQIYAVEEQPLPYLAMEYVDGQTLQQLFDAQGPIELQRLLVFAKQIATGLAAAHEKGLVHRDIKPGNILVESGFEPKVKITDFGLARTADDATVTRTGVIAGTPMYMAPEQAMAQTVDHRADLFSLGSVLYQMVTGRPPFRADSVLAVLKRVVEDRPRQMREIIPETPSWLCEVIEKLHEKKPENRIQSAREVADLFAEFERRLTAGEPIPNIQTSGPTSQAQTFRSLAVPVISVLAACFLLAMFLPSMGWQNWFSRGGRDLNQSGENGGQVDLMDAQSQNTLAEKNVALNQFIEEMKRLNPGFAGSVQSVIEDEEVMELTFETTSVTNLAPIAKFTKLRKLVACGPYYSTIKGQLTDLAPLRGLPLTTLLIDNNPIADFEPLRGMPLTSLSAIGSKVTDLSPLSKSPIETLMLWNGICTDLRPLSGTQIKWLNVGGSGKSIDLAPLKGVPLEFLCVNATQVSDLQPLRELPLRELLIERTNVQDLSPVLDCPLQTLRFQDSLVPDPSVVRNKALTSLSLNYVRARDYDWLGSMSALETINEIPASNFWQAVKRDDAATPLADKAPTTDNDRRAAQLILNLRCERGLSVNRSFDPIYHIDDLPKEPFRLSVMFVHSYRGDVQRICDALVKCQHLEGVDFSGCSIDAQTMNGLAVCSSLREINLSGAFTGEFRQLQIERFQAVEDLNLGSMPLNAAIIKRLKSLPALRSVYLGDNESLLDEWLPLLADCKSLRKLWIRATPITDAGLKHLAQMPWLTDIDVQVTRVTESGVRQLAEALPKCIIRWNGGLIEP